MIYYLFCYFWVYSFVVVRDCIDDSGFEVMLMYLGFIVIGSYVDVYGFILVLNYVDMYGLCCI